MGRRQRRRHGASHLTHALPLSCQLRAEYWEGGHVEARPRGRVCGELKHGGNSSFKTPHQASQEERAAKAAAAAAKKAAATEHAKGVAQRKAEKNVRAAAAAAAKEAKAAAKAAKAEAKAAAAAAKGACPAADPTVPDQLTVWSHEEELALIEACAKVFPGPSRRLTTCGRRWRLSSGKGASFVSTVRISAESLRFLLF